MRFCVTDLTLPGHTCILCRNTSSQDPSASFHHFPGPNNTWRAQWVQLFGMDESQLNPSHKCSWDTFPVVTPQKKAHLYPGQKVALPIKKASNMQPWWWRRPGDSGSGDGCNMTSYFANMQQKTQLQQTGRETKLGALRPFLFKPPKRGDSDLS